MADYTPLVSIVIPVYNGSNYLKEAVDCVLIQDYNSVEIVVVNDGSTDGGKTREIALSYGDKIRYFEKENGGVSSALNHGIEMMAGEYFTWLSHDDILGPRYISSQIQCIKKSGKDAAICRVGVIDENSKIVSEYHNWNIPFFITDKPFVSNMIWLYACCILVKKDFFEKAGYFSNQFRTCQDIEYTYNVLHYVDCVFNRSTQGYRREHTTNDSKNEHVAERMKIELRQLFIKINKEKSIWFFFTKNNVRLSRVKKLFYLLTLSSSFKTFNQIDTLYELTSWNKTLLKICYSFSIRFIYMLRIRNLIMRSLK